MNEAVWNCPECDHDRCAVTGWIYGHSNILIGLVLHCLRCETTFREML